MAGRVRDNAPSGRFPGRKRPETCHRPGYPTPSLPESGLSRSFSGPGTRGAGCGGGSARSGSAGCGLRPARRGRFAPPPRRGSVSALRTPRLPGLARFPGVGRSPAAAVRRAFALLPVGLAASPRAATGEATLRIRPGGQPRRLLSAGTDRDPEGRREKERDNGGNCKGGGREPVILQVTGGITSDSAGLERENARKVAKSGVIAHPPFAGMSVMPPVSGPETGGARGRGRAGRRLHPGPTPVPGAPRGG